MIEPILAFASLFGTGMRLNEDLIVKKQNRYFLVSKTLKKMMPEDFFYAGTYLGKVKNEKFFPSFELLRMMAQRKSNRVVVDKKTEWLFICGRDIFKQGIMETTSLGRRGEYVLVLDQQGDCLGFGRIVYDLDKAKRGVAIKNISDIGDFLRREKQRS